MAAPFERQGATRYTSPSARGPSSDLHQWMAGILALSAFAGFGFIFFGTLFAEGNLALLGLLFWLLFLPMALIVLDQKDAVIQKSANNLAGVKTLMAHYLNVIDLLNFDTVVISRAAVDVIESYLGQSDSAIDADTADTDADTADGEA